MAFDHVAVNFPRVTRLQLRLKTGRELDASKLAERLVSADDIKAVSAYVLDPQAAAAAALRFEDLDLLRFCSCRSQQHCSEKHHAKEIAHHTVCPHLRCRGCGDDPVLSLPLVAAPCPHAS